MLGSFFIYLSVFSLSVFNYYLSNKISIKGRKRDGILKKILRFVFIFFPVIILYGLRKNVGRDYLEYWNMSKYLMAHPTYNIWTSYMEAGYLALNKLANIIFKDPQGIFGLVGILLFAILFETFEKQKKMINVVLAYYIFLMTNFAFSCNGVRQMIAAAILLYGYRYIIEGNFKRYLLVVVMAAFFHYSVLLCLVFYLVRFFKKKQIIYFKCGSVVLASMLIIFPKLIYKIIDLLGYNDLLRFEANQGISGLFFWGYLVPELLFIEFYKKDLTEKNYQYEYYIGLLYLQIPLQMSGYINSQIERFSKYIDVLQIILVPMIINAICDTKKRKNALLITLVWYVFYFFVMNILFDGNKIVPYQIYKFF